MKLFECIYFLKAFLDSDSIDPTGDSVLVTAKDNMDFHIEQDF